MSLIREEWWEKERREARERLKEGLPPRDNQERERMGQLEYFAQSAADRKEKEEEKVFREQVLKREKELIRAEKSGVLIAMTPNLTVRELKLNQKLSCEANEKLVRECLEEIVNQFADGPGHLNGYGGLCFRDHRIKDILGKKRVAP